MNLIVVDADKLHDIDDDLAFIEDTLKGSDGDKLTYCRKRLLHIISTSKRFSQVIEEFYDKQKQKL